VRVPAPNGEQLEDAARSIGVSAAAAAFAFLASLIIVALSGNSAADALQTFWDGAFGTKQAFAGTLTKMIPLSLVAVGWIVAFSAGRINVGFEGQILMGGAAACVVGLEITGLPAALHLPLGVLAGALGGAALGGAAAWLWARRGVNEVISTLILSFVAIQFVSWLIRHPLSRSEFSFMTEAVQESARWPNLLSQTPLSWDFVLVPLLLVAVAFVMRRTVFGYHLRLTGANEDAARHAGVEPVRIGVVALMLSAALAGVAGSSLILASETYTMSDGFSSGYGFDGIVVALLARNAVAGVLPAALLFAAFRQSAGLLEARLDIASELVLLIQGLVVLALAGSAFLLDRRRSARIDAPARPAEEAAS
jgi:general nucleoside transport system permease protein